MNSCQPLRFISTQASCRNHAGRQDIVTLYQQHLKRVAVFAKASRSKQIIKIIKIKHHIGLSGQSQHTEALTAAHKAVQTAAQVQHVLVHNHLTRAVHNQSLDLLKPLSRTFSLCSPAQSVGAPNVQQTSRSHMLVKVREEGKTGIQVSFKQSSRFQMHRDECDVDQYHHFLYLYETWRLRLVLICAELQILKTSLHSSRDSSMPRRCCSVTSSNLFLCHLNM